ncbi:MAG: hypothetical protein N4A61_09355 [Pelagimonas sp.]|jgi:predicted anti-sigma-YlaC factor YlaD|nr:hypothetical protein [Pelagimonas sp.]
MGGSPIFVLLMLSGALIMGASSWRRRRIRKAVRDLPTAMARQLGDDPLFEPPAVGNIPEGLRAYAGQYRRYARIEKTVWALAFVWLAYVLVLVLRGN